MDAESLARGFGMMLKVVVGISLAVGIAAGLGIAAAWSYFA